MNRSSRRTAIGSVRAGWLALLVVLAIGLLGAGRYFFPNDRDASADPALGIPARCLEAHAAAGGGASGGECPYRQRPSREPGGRW
jgi:hypothetical protein